jgi:flagellar hook assembly protein FlgD
MSGVGRVKIADASVKGVVIRVTEGLALPKEFALGQNYPNPFNPSTRFTVDVPKISDVTVAIYDILGRQITTLLTGQQTAGVKTIEWDGTDARGTVVPTGVYFVRMSAEDFSATHKIMLMK